MFFYQLCPDYCRPASWTAGFPRKPEDGAADAGTGKVLYHIYIFPDIELLIGKKRADRFFYVPYPGCGR